jgi:hypothetical protein
MTPLPDLKARVLAQAQLAPAPDRRAVRRRATRTWLVVAVVTFVAFGALGGLRAVERPFAFVLATAAGWAGVAAAATWCSARRGSMAGRPLSVLVAGILLTPPALLAWYTAWVCRADEPVPSTPVGRAFVCMAICVALAASPFVAFAITRRGSAPVHPRATAAALGVVACAWASVLMDLHCEHADVLHVCLGHVAPVFIVGLLGFLLGERLFGVHADQGVAASRTKGRAIKSA